jgi:hypothetical protein
MLRPTLDEVFANVIASVDDIIKPDVRDPYASSIVLTVSNLLRHLRARAAHEPEALWHDNRDLRALLGELGVATPAAPDPSQYPSLALLVEEAVALRAVLDEYVGAHPGDERVRSYLGRQLHRQRPWMVEAWEGPRR